MALWMVVDLAERAGGGQGQGQAGEEEEVVVDAWDAWNQVRTLCESHNLLGCVLQLPPNLPALAAPGPAGQPQLPLFARWLGEPVKVS